MQDINIVEHVKSELPRDVFLKIIGIACCDIDTRIRLGFVGKLRIPKDFEERMRALAQPMQCSENTTTTLLRLGYNASITTQFKHKIVFFYRNNVIQDFGTLIYNIETDTGRQYTTCARRQVDYPFEVDPIISYYT